MMRPRICTIVALLFVLCGTSYAIAQTIATPPPQGATLELLGKLVAPTGPSNGFDAIHLCALR